MPGQPKMLLHDPRYVPTPVQQSLLGKVLAEALADLHTQRTHLLQDQRIVAVLKGMLWHIPEEGVVVVVVD